MKKHPSTPQEIYAANYGLAAKYNAFNDPEIERLGLCPVCLIDKDHCHCQLPPEHKNLWQTVKEWFHG